MSSTCSSLDLTQVTSFEIQTLSVEDSPRPNTGRDGVASLHADLRSGEVLDASDTAVSRDGDLVVVEPPDKENRDTYQRDTVLSGAYICGQSHLANIESLLTDHCPKRLYENRPLFKR